MAQQHPLNALVRTLDRQVVLSAEDKAAIFALPVTTRAAEANSYLVREGERAPVCMVLTEGYAFRHKLTRAGARQIVSIHIPGEAIDFQNMFLECSDHSIQALTQVDLAVVPAVAMRTLFDDRPLISNAMFRAAVVEAAIYREWLVNNSRRDARTRLAHLLCEFAVRLQAQELVGRDGFSLPMTQEQLGDALGLTAVHVNRSLRALAEAGLIERQGRAVTFPSIEALRDVGDFNARYLHLPGQ